MKKSIVVTVFLFVVVIANAFNSLKPDDYFYVIQESQPVENPQYQIIPIQKKATYDFQKNADRLYKRASEVLGKKNINPETAHSEKLTYDGRNIFLVYGEHYNPLHIRNMEQIFKKENVSKNKEKWLFLISGITANSANHSDYAEIEYAAQSAQAWNIPAENIIPNYNEPQVFQELSTLVGSEKAIFYLVMFGMQLGDINFIEGKGYDQNQIRSVIDNYIQICRDKNISFLGSRLNTLFPISNESWEKIAEECWDIHNDIRNEITFENLQKTLQRYPNVKNILFYCGSEQAIIFRQLVRSD